MRQENNGIRYFGFNELPNVKSVKRQKAPDEQRAKIIGNCKVCGEPMVFIGGTNVVVCKNPACKKRSSKILTHKEARILDESR